MAASTLLLKPETSQPQERAEQDLPPKSYADAVTNSTSEKSGQGDVNQSGNYGADDNLENPRGETAGSVNGSTAVNSDIAKPTGSERADESKAHERRTGGEKVEIDKVVYEKHGNNRGEHLTSVKPNDGYEKSPEHDRQTVPREKKSAKTTRIAKKNGEKSHLASGRRAGAGWERSA
jgi:2-acylglycerol O-acyltransferase 2